MIITLTGIPRSGTAFCSTLFQLHPDCIAFHELAMYHRNYKQLIYTAPFPQVADCNTYGYLDAAQINSDRRILIDTDFEYSHRSSEVATKKKLSLQASKTLCNLAHIWADEYKAMIIKREDVFTVQGCKRIWEYCFDEPFPEQKVAQLIKLNIQHHNAHLVCGKGTELIL